MVTSDFSGAEIPIIQTNRLLLRGHRPDDLEDCAALWSHPIVIRHTVGKPLTREEVWARLLRYAGHWAWLRYGYWAIEDKATGGFVGELGFAHLKREIEPSFGDTPEIGWILAPSAHGKGYATEAIRAALVWGDAHFGAQRTACMIHPDNLPSPRFASRRDVATGNISAQPTWASQRSCLHATLPPRAEAACAGQRHRESVILRGIWLLREITSFPTCAT